MGKATLNISIVTYKEDIEVLEKVLGSCINFSGKSKITIIDHSPFNTLKPVVEGYQNTQYIFNPSNPGYGAGHNMALKHTIEEDVKYHIVMNPDIYFENGVLESIINFLDENEHIGMLMPKILFPNNEVQYLCKLLPTPWDLIFRRFIPFKQLTDKRNNIYELRFTGYNRMINVPCISGCFMVLRTSVVKKVGIFDENFFMYLEDVDLSRRMGVQSTNIFFPEANVFHHYKKGSYKNIALLKNHILSAIRYFNKYGWVFDRERKQINKRTLEELQYHQKF